MSNQKKILLVDGHSLAYRAYYALPDSLTTSDGKPTNAVYGFASMFMKVLEQEKPDSVVVAFDVSRKDLKRTGKFPEYKSHRKPMPDDLREQVEKIKELLEAMKVPAVWLSGYEADDVLGTLAERASKGGDLAVIVTGDRDVLQLAGEGVRVLMTGRGITETTDFDCEAVIEKYGVTPERLPDVTGLKGDTSDNIPGVPGIGEKGATSLIAEYGSLEGVYEHIEEISGKRRESLEENRDTAFLSRELAIIEKDVPLEVGPESGELGSWDVGEVLEAFSRLEFKTLARRFLDIFCGEDARREAATHGVASDIDCTLFEPEEGDQFSSFEEECRSGGAVAVEAVMAGSSYCDYEIKMLALAGPHRAVVLGFPEALDTKAGIAALDILGSESVEKWFHGAKPVLEAMDRAGYAFANLGFDTEVAAYLENPSAGSYQLNELWEKHHGARLNLDGDAPEEEVQSSLMPEHEEGAAARTAAAALRVFHLKEILDEKLAGIEERELFYDLEMPLVEVLKEIEEAGVGVEPAIIEDLSVEAGESMAELEEEVYRLAGHPFNLGSTKQLAEVLFEEMGIEPVKKTKTGYSTDSSVLEILKETCEIAGKVIDYREYSKLKSTYLDVLPALVCPQTGKIHCSLNQTATATGRISSSNPNLQNIPVRTEEGRRIREAFVPGVEGWRMLVADYSQIELRVLAHLSGDPGLMEAFERDEDVHRGTAAKVFGVEQGEVTPDQRRVAKMVNFGVIYGMGSYGLASRLGISREKAADFIERYFEEYGGVREFQERCVSECTRTGYAVTLMGRRRYLPELSSGKRQVREFGERLAVNTPIQGSAADIIKKAMVELSSSLKEEGMRSRMTLQVHDELLFDAAPDEEEALESMVRASMSGACRLNVPLKVDIRLCDNWGEAK